MHGKITELHELLLKATPAKGQNGGIALYDKFHKIKDGAIEWLHGLDKNGFEHSERVEKYLNRLTEVLTENGRLHTLKSLCFCALPICTILATCPA